MTRLYLQVKKSLRDLVRVLLECTLVSHGGLKSQHDQSRWTEYFRNEIVLWDSTICFSDSRFL